MFFNIFSQYSLKLNNIQLLNIIRFRSDEFFQQANHEIQANFQTLQNIAFQIHQKNAQIIRLFQQNQDLFLQGRKDSKTLKFFIHIAIFYFSTILMTVNSSYRDEIFEIIY